MNQNQLKTTAIFLLLVTLATGCTWTDRGGELRLGRGKRFSATDSCYTCKKAMSIYGYQPLRALQILDSACVVGNMTPVRADMFRVRIYSYTQMPDQVDSLLGGPKGVRYDSARAMGERLLCHDSLMSDPERHLDVLEVLAYTARQQNDTMKWMRRSNEYVDLCRQLGADHETSALRTTAEIGAALHSLGRHQQGMAKIDSVINLLDASFHREENRGRFNELDALIIALKRKIVVLGSHGQYAETLPLARHIIELLDEYDQHPEAYHDSTQREPDNDQKRGDYIRFYRIQAQSFITAAYASLGEQGNMVEAFERIERGVHDATAREHIARYNALQQQMEAERQQAKAYRSTLVAISLGVFALFSLVIAIVVIVKNRAIHRKNRLLAHRISEAINYKRMYIEEMRAQPLTEAPDINTLSDEQLFRYISDVIVRERLFLDPKFERQTIMDRFQLTKERVGAIFSKGSDYSKLTSYIQQLRLEYAAKILVEQPDLNIVQIASESGFSSSTYFSNCFRQHFGMSPTDYRRNAISQSDDNMTQ